MTHKELVEQAEKQLKRWSCLPICVEMMAATTTNEIPDAIGFTSAHSILFECKATRSDFLKDKKSRFELYLKVEWETFVFTSRMKMS